MKKFMFLSFALLAFACSPQQKSEENTAEIVGKYGAEISETGMISVDDMVAKLSESDSIMVKVKGEITATCAMKGCWMNLVMPNGEEMRVTFKDYAFFVPKEGMEGNEALIEGVVTRTVTDVETLRHYAEDAGKPQSIIDAITEAKEELAFEASGVIIYKTQVEEQTSTTE
ncbi:DUF4920 domain-containing protein [Roseivirga sp. E12]|uniref:DUF4920 domain-containing protein n=1 Tax=Roseivirga sp. E12 TaxID=2819237 RepID=UPI001ABBFFC7|nr:DUF4920 domain-containing protein [Roseivirga sp. E12]MBO3698982.1 DUF4920 domain-containing protein [Roseivirga sp. E12]